jgi:hypothetical protein
MLSKRRLAGGKVQVTFSAPQLKGVARVFLVGEFNDWNTSLMPMTAKADGCWSVVLTLDAGRMYAFRYLVPGQGWHNDWAAHPYIPNEFGSENSIVDLRPFADAPAEPPKAVKKTVAVKLRSAAKKPPAAKVVKAKTTVAKEVTLKKKTTAMPGKTKATPPTKAIPKRK